MTPAEKILWQELRANKLGVHFRRQQVIEVDGDIHDLQKEEDAKREKVLSKMGLRIIRFGNDEVVRDLADVVRKVRGLVLGLEKSSV